MEVTGVFSLWLCFIPVSAAPLLPQPQSAQVRTADIACSADLTLDEAFAAGGRPRFVLHSA